MRPIPSGESKSPGRITSAMCCSFYSVNVAGIRSMQACAEDIAIVIAILAQRSTVLAPFGLPGQYVSRCKRPWRLSAAPTSLQFSPACTAISRSASTTPSSMLFKPQT